MTGEVSRNSAPMVEQVNAPPIQEAVPKSVEELQLLKSTLESLKGQELSPSLQAKIDKFLASVGDPAHPQLEPGSNVTASMLLNDIQAAMKSIKIAQKMFSVLGKLSALVNNSDFQAQLAKTDPNAGTGDFKGPFGVRTPAGLAEQSLGNVQSWLVGNVQTAFTVAMMLLADLQKDITADNTKLALLQRDLQIEMRNTKMDQQMQKAIANKDMLMEQAYAAVAYAATQAALAGLSLGLTIYASGIEQKQKEIDGVKQFDANNKPVMVDAMDKNGNPIHNPDYSRAVDSVSQSIGGFGGATDKFIQAGYQTKLAAFDQMITLVDDMYQAASKQQDKMMQNAAKAQEMLQQMLDQLSQWHDRVTQIHISATGN